MKTRRGIAVLVALMCAAVLCLALGACSGGGGGGAEASFPGKWVTVQVVQDGETLTYDQADDVTKAKMDETYIVINEDGTATMCDGGYEATGTWEATGPTEAKGTFEGMEFDLTINDGLLSVSSGGITVVMQKS